MSVRVTVFYRIDLVFFWFCFIGVRGEHKHFWFIVRTTPHTTEENRHTGGKRVQGHTGVRTCSQTGKTVASESGFCPQWHRDGNAYMVNQEGKGE